MDVGLDIFATLVGLLDAIAAVRPKLERAMRLTLVAPGNVRHPVDDLPDALAGLSFCAIDFTTRGKTAGAPNHHLSVHWTAGRPHTVRDPARRAQHRARLRLSVRAARSRGSCGVWGSRRP